MPGLTFITAPFTLVRAFCTDQSVPFSTLRLTRAGGQIRGQIRSFCFTGFRSPPWMRARPNRGACR